MGRIVPLALAACLLLAGGALHAEPYLAVQQGYKCSACHVNATGGGLRNDFGVVFAGNVMPASRLPDSVPAWTGKLGELVRLGGDLRASWTRTEVPGSEALQQFDLDQLRVYADIAVIGDRLDLYVDEGLAPGNARELEAYVRYGDPARGWYIKGGQFYLPFETTASGPLLSLSAEDSRLILPEGGAGCGTLFLSTDASYESALSWSVVARALPIWGAFAEPFSANDATICSVVLDLTRSETTATSGPVDVFVWLDDHGIPGQVVGVNIGAPVGTVTAWPELSRVVIPLSGVCADGPIWVGFIGAWLTPRDAAYIGVDTDWEPSGGMTNVPPGAGPIEGWRPISEVYPAARSIGIGCEMLICAPVDGR